MKPFRVSFIVRECLYLSETKQEQLEFDRYSYAKEVFAARDGGRQPCL